MFSQLCTLIATLEEACMLGVPLEACGGFVWP